MEHDAVSTITLVSAGIPEFLAPKQFAKAWGCHPDTARRWLRDGTIPSVRIGRRRRVPRSVLARMIVEQMGGAA